LARVQLQGCLVGSHRDTKLHTTTGVFGRLTLRHKATSVWRMLVWQSQGCVIIYAK